MYRILIADDEGIMLESLKNIISSNLEMNVRSIQPRQAVWLWRRRRNIRRISALWTFRCRA